ncbi:MAG: hypothetical protein R8K22_04440 [Mariprofundaceae bacterium]
MAKYIDLLRAHQNKNSQPEKAEPNAIASPFQNDEIDHKAQTSGLEELLHDESSHAEMESCPEDILMADELLSEDEELEPTTISTNTAQEEPSPETPEIIPTNPKTASKNTCTDWLFQCAELITGIYQKAKKEQESSIQALSKHLNELLSQLKNDAELIDILELDIASNIKKISLLDSNLGSLIQKSIMMMLYTIKISTPLKLNEDETRSHILAAMLHHIGMAQISSEIRHKKDRLDKDEIAQIRQASGKGHDYLTLCGITDASILLAAKQSQERYDGSGPQEIVGSDIAYSARLTGLLSLFEALIHYRP